MPADYSRGQRTINYTYNLADHQVAAYGN